MGCSKSKKKRTKVNLQGNENFDREGQERKLTEILQRINSEIEITKREYKNKFVNNNNLIKQKLELANNDITKEQIFALGKRSCYLSQLLIFVRWTIKVRQVNQADKRFDEIIENLSNMIENDDEFLLSSLENKIRHILNKINK